MNSLLGNLNLWGERFLNFAGPMLWQSSLLIIGLFALDLALRRKVRAAVRYALWLVVLVKLLLPPSLALPTGIAWWVRPTPPPKPQPQQYIVTHFGQAQPPTTSEVSGALVAGAFEIPKSRLSPAAWSVTVSGVINVTLLLWMISRWRHVARMVRAASPALQEWNGLLDDARRRIGVRRTVPLRMTDLPMSPAVCGLFRPVILLPRSLAEHLPPSQLRNVLLHELVHLKRGDVWVNCAQALLQIVYWWHPLLWLANARIRRLREEAVDDAVMLALRDEAPTYAPTLLEVARLAFHRPTMALGLIGIMESRSALRQRIERLVDFRPPRKAGLTIASGLCVLAFAVLAVPMEQAPATIATQVSTPKQTESASLPPVEPSNDAEEVKLRVIVLYKHLAGDAALKRKAAEDIRAKIKGGAAFSEMASVFSEDRRKGEGGDWGWVRKYDRDGAPVLRKELADAAFSLKPGEVSDVIETPAMICLMLVEDKRPALIEAPPSSPVATETNAAAFVQNGRRLLEMGKVDEAEAEFKKALVLDPENQPAYYYLRSVKEAQYRNTEDKAKTERKVWIEDKALPPAKADSRTNTVYTSQARQRIINKLQRIRLERVFYDNLLLEDVIRRLNEEAKRHDPDGRGVNFILNSGPDQPRPTVIDPSTGLPPVKNFVDAPDLNWPLIKVSPALNNLTLGDVLDIIVKVADRPIRYSIEDFGVVFSVGGANEPLYQRRFKVVSPSFDKWLQYAATAVPVAATQSPKRGGVDFLTVTNNLEQVHQALRGLSSASGVDLGPPKLIFYGDRKGILLVNATQSDLDAIERLVEKWNTTSPPAVPAAVSPSARSSNNTTLESLDPKVQEVAPRATQSGIDSLPEPNRRTTFGLADALPKSLYENTRGPRSSLAHQFGLTNAAPRILIETTFVEMANFDPDAEPGDSPLRILPKDDPGNMPAPAKPSKAETELRSKFSEKNNLILETGSPPTVTRILTEAQASALLERIHNRSGADVLCPPKVISKSGQPAQIQMTGIRTVVSGVETNAIVDASGKPHPGINYLTENIPFGTMLEVEPRFVDNGSPEIHLSVSACVTEFIGYDDPGEFRIAVGEPGAQPVKGVLPLPRVRLRELEASASLENGQTILLGGLINHEVRRVKDKVPLLGDIPGLGRLFRRTQTSLVKKHLVVLVKVVLVKDEAEPANDARITR